MMRIRWAAGVMLLSLLLPFPAKAREPVDPAREITLTVKTEHNGTALEDAVIRLYQISDMAPGGQLTPLPEYAAFSELLDIRGENAAAWEAAAKALSNQIKKEKCPPTARESSDTRGTAVFSNLPRGLYLLTGLKHRQGDVLYRSSPTFVMLPGIHPQTEQWEYAPTIYVKPEAIENPDAQISEIPKTGMRLWPLPVMLISGGLLLLLEIWRRKEQKNG